MGYLSLDHYSSESWGTSKNTGLVKAGFDQDLLENEDTLRIAECKEKGFLKTASIQVGGQELKALLNTNTAIGEFGISENGNVYKLQEFKWEKIGVLDQYTNQDTWLGIPNTNKDQAKVSSLAGAFDPTSPQPKIATLSESAQLWLALLEDPGTAALTTAEQETLFNLTEQPLEKLNSSQLLQLGSLLARSRSDVAFMQRIGPQVDAVCKRALSMASTQLAPSQVLFGYADIEAGVHKTNSEWSTQATAELTKLMQLDQLLQTLASSADGQTLIDDSFEALSNQQKLDLNNRCNEASSLTEMLLLEGFNYPPGKERNAYFEKIGATLSALGISTNDIKTCYAELTRLGGKTSGAEWSTQFNAVGKTINQQFDPKILSHIQSTLDKPVQDPATKQQIATLNDNLSWYAKQIPKYTWSSNGEGGINADGSTDGLSCIHNSLEGLLVGLGVSDAERELINFNMDMRTGNELPSMLPREHVAGDPIVLSTRSLSPLQIELQLKPNGELFVIQTQEIEINDNDPELGRQHDVQPHHTVLLYYGNLDNPATGQSETRWWVLESTEKTKPDGRSGGWNIPFETWTARHSRGVLSCTPIKTSAVQAFDTQSQFAQIFSQPQAGLDYMGLLADNQIAVNDSYDGYAAPP